MTTVRVPTGTQKGVIFGLNGLAYRTCNADTGLCLENQPREKTYYDAAGDVTTDICNAESVDLLASTTCNCGDTINALVPDALDGTAEGTPLFTEEYANDGSAIPDLALAGAILAAFVSADEECAGAGYWDSVAPMPPTGFVYLPIVPVSAEASVAAAV